MAKTAEFYPRYIEALFKRGKADVLPMDYLMDEARKVLDADELETMKRVFSEMVAEGRILDKEEGYSWPEGA
ncbi:MAG: hypothetical protein D6E12_14980 [Desulfovibrio sp.]|nr:MAG: hypothetical protein D6E12_14980 [Desulfovibrio sp.]